MRSIQSLIIDTRLEADGVREAETNEQEATLAKREIHDEWESHYRTADNERFYNQCFDAILRDHCAPPGSTFLDVGCGIGAHSVRLAERGYRVEAVDFSESILEATRKNVDAHNLGQMISVCQGNLRDLPYADGEFDYVLCWGVLMHVPDLEGAISELVRVVAPGGSLVVSEDNMHSVQSVTFRTLLRLLGRRREVQWTDAGIEKWKETDAGKLMTRETRIPWLICAFEKRGLRLRARKSGQFTEAYVRVASPTLQRAIHALNSAWFRYGGPPQLAFANIMIFERPA